MKILKPHKGGRSSRVDYKSFTHKECSNCKAIKPVSEFYTSKVGTHAGWSYHSFCKKCDNASSRKYGVTNRNRRNTRLQQWRKDNPEQARKNDFKKRIKLQYGLTVEQHEEMLKDAGNRCEICRRNPSKLCIDHSHKSGKVRGILCCSCNSFIGRLETHGNFIPLLEKYLIERCDVLLEMANK